ncbi:hypothetical protein FVF58_23975 [Paraburkholderia panacisoli]|uniref:Uncharacterized protein n=1 Tax=Paraburkholderia panacisoli TaxID=2603818 RepID=A0A5B0GY78_9BURK|nr:hypothetical protein [Paraburkholderia panacisoli]KAA1007771.1 hypothetical protein FVF58_23975 [Paraburkholderia panacisoli]
MSQMLSFDDEARAEMLCYLVIGELVAMARTGEWLRTDHLVESARIWMTANGAKCDWQDRVALAQTAAELAPKVLASFQLATEQSLAPLSRMAGCSTIDRRSSATSMGSAPLD